MNENFANPQSLEEALEPGSTKKKNWAAFIESDAVNFFNRFEIEKMTLDDGRGNKAKLARTKDNEIKVEYTSSVTL
ncbi:MAG: hypothetical protein IJP07_06580 [Firmicutes bacterium]|nr:hypothetical protein [Bacillota bacterium]